MAYTRPIDLLYISILDMASPETDQGTTQRVEAYRAAVDQRHFEIRMTRSDESSLYEAVIEETPMRPSETISIAEGVPMLVPDEQRRRERARVYGDGWLETYTRVVSLLIQGATTGKWTLASS